MLGTADKKKFSLSSSIGVAFLVGRKKILESALEFLRLHRWSIKAKSSFIHPIFVDKYHINSFPVD